MDYMVIQRLDDKKFLAMQGWMNDVTAAEFFNDEEEALALAGRITEHEGSAQVLYVTISLSNVKS